MPAVRPWAALVSPGRSRALSSKTAAQRRLILLGSKRAALDRLGNAVALQPGSEQLWPLEALSHVRQALTMVHPVRDSPVDRQRRILPMRQKLSR